MSLFLLNPKLVGAGGAGGGGGGSFSPPSISSANYKHWSEARHETGYANNDPAGTSTDVSGAGNNWTQGTAGKKPLYKTNQINGLPAYSFDAASQQHWSLASDILSGKSAGEIFILVKLNNDPGASNKDGLWKMDGDGTNATNFPYNGDGNIYDGWGSTARKSTGVNPSPQLTSWTLYNVRSGSGEWKAFQNGTQIYTTATNTFSSFGATRYFGRSVGLFGDTYLDGLFAGMVIVDNLLNSTDKSAIKSVFASAYALTIA